jgi:phosphoribosyl-AMP cyclohydrolase / phosphoribosyl-ATP pyrophosphohydrolase
MDIGVTKSKILLEAVRYDSKTGLVPVVVQSVETGAVLMVAYANREALKRTLGTGDAWFWSRSRQDYWRKGATSGNTQHVVEVRLDCDGDSVLYLVKAKGPACHTGEMSCFYRTVSHYDPTEQGHACEAPVEEKSDQNLALQKVQDTQNPDVLGHDDEPRYEPDWDVLTKLWNLVVSRDVERPNGSYTTYLFEHGVDKIAKKVGEEATEVVIAAKNSTILQEDSRVELAKESADLLYHLLALWRISKIVPDDVLSVLREREK